VRVHDIYLVCNTTVIRKMRLAAASDGSILARTGLISSISIRALIRDCDAVASADAIALPLSESPGGYPIEYFPAPIPR
jgi:hypothetical protein